MEARSNLQDPARIFSYHQFAWKFVAVTVDHKCYVMILECWIVDHCHAVAIGPECHSVRRAELDQRNTPAGLRVDYVHPIWSAAPARRSDGQNDKSDAIDAAHDPILSGFAER